METTTTLTCKPARAVPERISSAAIVRYGVIVTGSNHAACLAQLPPRRNRAGETQGFITTRGRFVNRREAFAIAQRMGQLKPNVHSTYELFSEDLAIRG